MLICRKIHSEFSKRTVFPYEPCGSITSIKRQRKTTSVEPLSSDDDIWNWLRNYMQTSVDFMVLKTNSNDISIRKYWMFHRQHKISYRKMHIWVKIYLLVKLNTYFRQIKLTAFVNKHGSRWFRSRFLCWMNHIFSNVPRNSFSYRINIYIKCSNFQTKKIGQPPFNL